MKKLLIAFKLLVSLHFALAQQTTYQAALNLDGTDDEIRIPGALDLLTGSTEITLSCWAYLRNTAPAFPNFDGIVGFRNDVSADFYILQLSDNQIEARFRNSNFDPPFTIAHTGDFTLNTWQHFAMSYNGSMLRLYINGVQVDSLPASGFLGETGGDLMAGFLYFNPTVNYALDGQIDEVGLWNRALSNEEIACLYSGAISLTSPGLLACLRFNEGMPAGDNTSITEIVNLVGAPNATLSGLALTGESSNYTNGINNYQNSTAQLCGNSISFGTITITEPGVYYQEFETSGVCDSLVELVVSAQNLNTNVNTAGNTLISLASGVNYQWIDCDSGNEISGATQQTFSPTNSGNYAVIVSANACSDTSACISVNTAGITSVLGTQFTVMPNPANERVFIHATSPISFTIELMSLQGKLICTQQGTGGTQAFDLQNIPPGCYLLNIIEANHRYTQKLIVE
ncbi:MAG: LamG-like jellyroll fold domain-containing protein [Bacteroidia bacterium]|jgi:hypothetical protein